MLNFSIKGRIIHFFEKENLYSTIYENQSFQKRKIIIESESQEITISFSNKKLKLLEYCRIGSEVEASVSLKGRTWEVENKKYSINELSCNSLKIIKNTQIDYLIRYKNGLFNLKRFYIDGNLNLVLVDYIYGKEIKLNFEYTFPDKNINKDHILFRENLDGDLLKELENQGILTNLKYIKTSEGYCGYICRILILDVYKDRELLFPRLKGFENLYEKDYKDYEWDRNIEDYSEDITDYTNYDDNLDMDQQSDEFWNQF